MRIARCRTVRHSGSAIVKIPRNQEVLADPEGLPVVYLARIVTTLEHCRSSSNVGGSPPFMVNTEKSSMVQSVFSPRDKINKLVAGSDGSKFVASCNDCSPVTENAGCFLNVGSGEWLPKLPEGGLPVAVTSHQSPVTGMTYRRRAVLFPLRTDSVLKLTPIKLIRLKQIRKG